MKKDTFILFLKLYRLSPDYIIVFLKIPKAQLTVITPSKVCKKYQEVNILRLWKVKKQPSLMNKNVLLLYLIMVKIAVFMCLIRMIIKDGLYCCRRESYILKQIFRKCLILWGMKTILNYLNMTVTWTGHHHQWKNPEK